MHRICLCPASIAWIRKHLMKSARKTFTDMISPKFKGTKFKRKKSRSPAQRAATKKLVRLNRHRANLARSRRKFRTR